SGKAVSFNEDGSIVAIGASFNDGNGADSGHVRVYQWNGTIWNQLGSDIDGEAAGVQAGRIVQLSYDGLTLMVGSLTEAEIYDYNGTNWIQRGSDITGGHSLRGMALSGDGNTVAMGEYFSNNSGQVRVYEWNGASWSQVGSLVASSGYDTFASRISVNEDGTVFTVTALGNGGPSNEDDRVEVYAWDGSDWSQRGSDIVGGSGIEGVGTSVSITPDGSRIAIGIPLSDTSGTDRGRVEVYDWDGTTWNQVGTDILGELAGAEAGTSVSLSHDGTRLAVGEYQNDRVGTNQGVVRVFDYDGTDWQLIDYGIYGEVSGDYSGYSASLSGDGKRVAIGAYLNDGNGADSGHVRVYTLGTLTAPLVLEYTEGDGAVAIHPSSSNYIDTYSTFIYDDDDTHIESAEVEISSNYVNGEDVLGFTNQSGITGSFNATTGILTLSGSATKLAYEIALASVTYENTSLTPSELTRTISFKVNDGDADSAAATVTVEVSGVDNSNDIPDLYFNSPDQLGSDIDGEAASDQSGKAVSFNEDGSIVAIGASFNDGNGADSGHVRVYQWNGTIWNQLGSDIDGEAAGVQAGRIVQLSYDGLTLMVGSLTEAEIYDYNGTNWIQRGSDITGGHSLRGMALSGDGNTVAMGEYFSNNSGQVRVYEWNGASWSQVGSLVASSGYDTFASRISVNEDGTVFTVTALGNGGPSNEDDRVEVYAWDGSDWSQRGSDIVGGSGIEGVGTSVSITPDGSRIAIGIPLSDTSGTDRGRVEVYDWDGTTWNQVGTDILGELAGAEAGTSVSLSHDGLRLAIGEPYNDTQGNEAGAVRVYDYNGTDWQLTEHVIYGEAASDRFGTSISLSGDGKRVSIGAPLNDGTASAAGHVQIYLLGSSSETVAYTENDGAVTIFPGYEIYDVDDTNIESATVTMTNYMAAEDVIGYSAVAGITVDTTTAGMLLLSGSTSLSDYETFFAGVTYQNTSDDPDTTARTVTYVVNDGDANSNTITATINITSVNDEPSASDNTITTNEDTPYTFSASDFNFSDVDGDSLASVQITSLETVGDLKLNGTDVTLNQVIAVADITNGLLVFSSVLNANGASYDSFNFSVNDGTADSLSSYTMTVDVTAVNDAPDITIGGGSAAESLTETDTTLSTSGTLVATDVDLTDVVT
ncbi:Ig-like domain-containing protein, partial [Thiotrichales bacterium 19S11-10]|nr:Ig-like domain-containing protein [Thiotrichales bacterium 19S11-10]